MSPTRSRSSPGFGWLCCRGGLLSCFSGGFCDDVADVFNHSGYALVGQDATLYPP
jgi:hypothetical protein